MKKHTTLNHFPVFLIYALLFTFSIQACAQKSPPVKVKKEINGVNIEINYHAPSVRDRAIWGDLVPYDQVWRTGANNATTFEVDKDVKIGKEKVPAGKYALFTIPKKGEPWVLILNKEADQWGAYNYKDSEDLLRVDVETKRLLEMKEQMTFEIDNDGNVSFKWEYLSFQFKVLTK